MAKAPRALSVHQAQRCEDAAEPVCRCRCRGAFHGRNRGNVVDLPVTDPHSPSRECPRCHGKGRRDYLGTDLGICRTCDGTGRILAPSAAREKKFR